MYLSLVEFAYNNVWQEIIKNTPFMLNYGQHPLTPLNHGINRCPILITKDFAQLMSSILQEVKKHLLIAQNIQKILCSYKETRSFY